MCIKVQTALWITNNKVCCSFEFFIDLYHIFMLNHIFWFTRVVTWYNTLHQVVDFLDGIWFRAFQLTLEVTFRNDKFIIWIQISEFLSFNDFVQLEEHREVSNNAFDILLKKGRKIILDSKIKIILFVKISNQKFDQIIPSSIRSLGIKYQ